MFTVPATTEIYTLSLHDALPIYARQNLQKALEQLRKQEQKQQKPQQQKQQQKKHEPKPQPSKLTKEDADNKLRALRSEEHTSELQSRRDLVCRLLLEKKKKKYKTYIAQHIFFATLGMIDTVQTTSNMMTHAGCNRHRSRRHNVMYAVMAALSTTLLTP